MLPGLSGLELCKILRDRQDTSRLPILMLTAKAGEADKVVGLEMGADDYLSKPFSPREMVARVRAILRFFFSSRRQHTRWNCDWSSDVCSSDLGAEVRRILVEDNRARGVELVDGQVLRSKLVVSNADPKRTFLQLVGAETLEPAVTASIEALRTDFGDRKSVV